MWDKYSKGKSEKELIGNIGFGHPVNPDSSLKRKVLVTGKGSYIGQSFIHYAADHFSCNFEIDELDLMDATWKMTDFSCYDIIYHVAGIAHADVGNVSEDVKKKYYEVNTELAVEVANKAKKEGVKELFFMSSIIVYGESAPYGKAKVITENTIPFPSNFYGNSKLQADIAIRELADDDFKVVVLRPPMIYGKDSKGNYPLLSKFARKFPLFPYVKNQRSMLYIENLCEFLCQCMLIGKIDQHATVLIPQNLEWTNTCEMVRQIAEVCNNKICITRLISPLVLIGSNTPGKIGVLVNKAFGNCCYESALSSYEGIDYQLFSLHESIIRTEN